MNNAFLLRIGLLAGTAVCMALGPVSAALAAGPVTSGLSLWLESNQGLAADGSSWLDQSGNGNNATALPGQAPTVIPGAINGLPAVQFNGGQALSFSNQIITSQQFTIIAVASDATTSSSSNLGFREIFSNWDYANTVTSVFLGTTGINPTAVRFSDQIGGAVDPLHNQTGVGSIPNPGSPFVLSAVSGTTDASIFLNSSLFYDNGAALSPIDLTTSYYLGRQGSGTFNEYWNGTIEELLVYNYALSPTQLLANSQYLEVKYGISTVPEPSTWAMLLIGFAGLGFVGYRRNKGATFTA